MGNVDVELPGNIIEPFFGQVRTVRLQFGVFDDAAGEAPAGGFVGWNVGTLAVSGSTSNSDERRTPGRLSPFNFSAGPNANGQPPLPGGDPFTQLTEIDATLGTQSPSWVCGPGGIIPDPAPGAVVRGRNTFVSVYSFSIQRFQISSSYAVTASGNLIGATSWLTVGNPTPPDCGDPADPADDVPGSVTYAPFPTAPQAFTCVLSVIIPAPGGFAVIGLGGLLAARRRR